MGVIEERAVAVNAWIDSLVEDASNSARCSLVRGVFEADTVSTRLLKFQNSRRRATRVHGRTLARRLDWRHAMNKISMTKEWSAQIRIFGRCRNFASRIRPHINN